MVKLLSILFLILMNAASGLYADAPKKIEIVPFDAPMNFATVADEEHYPWLLILLNSIKRHNPDKKLQILVFDIGLLPDQIRAVESHYPAKVYPIEPVHPDLTKKFVVRSNGRLARGWYAWKPVAFKQAFDHVPYFLYLDAGKRLEAPCDNVFHCIVEQGYFLFDCGHEIEPMTTERAKNKFDLGTPPNNKILAQFGLDAGIQGLSKKVYEDYVLPMYILAHDIALFEDDGTAPWGFGGSRHDQTLFSILARKLNFNIIKVCGDGPDFFMVKNKKISFNRNDYFQFKEYSDNPLAAQNKLL